MKAAFKECPILAALLDDRAHHIEFNGHLTNHAKHAVVALAGLGVEAEQVRAYYEAYTSMTSYGHRVEPRRTIPCELTEKDWRLRKGKREGWSAYCALFDELARREGIAALMHRLLPELIPGWVGALAHPVIHLGFGMEVGHHHMMIEGLAYLAFAYQSCQPERAERPPSWVGNRTPMESLLSLARAWHANQVPLQAWVEAVVDDSSLDASLSLHPELRRSGLQRRFVKVSAVGHPLINGLPAWVEAPASGVWDDLFYVVTLLYLANPGDFVRLHYLTSLHAMRVIAMSLPERELPWVLRCYWVGLCAMLFAQSDLPPAELLVALDSQFRDSVDRPGTAANGQLWSDLVERAVRDPEEHNAKLVYVMRAQWLRTGLTIFRRAASEFTTTPQLPPSFAAPPTP